ncbi:MAG TPA: hypothetical protein IGS52_14005 [Oscillatoriaceae cyanobacterium M33_DOE_052]|nr:hypothetical protein [Oscillatoriaceae cyanobacterium M33_DOE_052]
MRGSNSSTPPLETGFLRQSWYLDRDLDKKPGFWNNPNLDKKPGFCPPIA